MSSEEGSGLGSSAGAFDAPPLAAAHTRIKWLGGQQPGFVWLVFGIIVPAFVVLLEVTTGFCASVLFDPIPTLWHTLLAAFVPVSNCILWQALRTGRKDRARMLGWLNGGAIGIALVYTLAFLPLMPIAAVAVIYFGLGLIPLAPALSLIAAVKAQRGLRQWRKSAAPPHRIPSEWAGLAVALAVFFIVELPYLTTQVGMQMAVSSDASTSIRGVQLLRFAGNRDAIVRAAHGRQGRALASGVLPDPFGKTVSTEDHRKIYYRVTGESFNEAPPLPSLGWSLRLFGDGGFDRDRGGSDAGGKVASLTLSGSRMDGTVDADAGVSYLEWTFVFRNSAAWQQEARAQILLPPEGVVSRLTLWIDGEEREAAFAGRAKVRQAYEEVVRQRRDPVLVTTAGLDRILVQCFPVPPNGGEMKVRIGITAPLALESRDRGALYLPRIVESNFEVDGALEHAVWIEAQKPLMALTAEPTQSSDFVSEERNSRPYVLRGSVKDSDLTRTSVVAKRSAAAVETRGAWTSARSSADNVIVTQRVEEQTIAAPSQAVLVLDGSAAMSAVSGEIAQALTTLPSNVDFHTIVAGDAPVELSGMETVATDVRNFGFEGGRDNIPSLLAAWDMAAAKPGGVIVWVHGPQSVAFHSIEDLRQRWDRRPDGPRLYELQIKNGRDVIVESFDRLNVVEAIRPDGGAGPALSRLFGSWKGQEKRLRFVRERVADARGESSPSEPASAASHLVRLWAHDETLRRLSSRRSHDDAVKLAAVYHIVTPVSGAVVLERQEQYDRAGLQPADPGSVPTAIPEPEEWELILVAVLAAALFIKKQRGRPQGISCCG